MTDYGLLMIKIGGAAYVQEPLREAYMVDLRKAVKEAIANAAAVERERLLPEREAVGLLLCSVSDNLGDMPVSDEWAEKTARAAHELLVRNDYFRA